MSKLQMTRLLENVLLKIAEKHKAEKFRMSYALYVMLPEVRSTLWGGRISSDVMCLVFQAMVRVKAKVEGISIEQALEEF